MLLRCISIRLTGPPLKASVVGLSDLGFVVMRALSAEFYASLAPTLGA